MLTSVMMVNAAKEKSGSLGVERVGGGWAPGGSGAGCFRASMVTARPPAHIAPAFGPLRIVMANEA